MRNTNANSVGPLVLLLTMAVAPHRSTAGAAETPPVVAGIRKEVVAKNHAASGWPLPVASHWARSWGASNFSSEYQVSLLEQGHHVMPNLPMPRPGEARLAAAELSGPVIDKLARWGAPFSMRGDNWEGLLLSKDHPQGEPGRWRNLPPAENARAINLDGTLGRMISPFGAAAPWHEAGRYYGQSGAFAELAKRYPNPPRVVLLSNNEAPRLKTKHDIEKLCKRFVDKFGSGCSELEKRTAIAESYPARYLAMLTGMREGLAEHAWSKHCLLAAYNGFGPPHFGRWDGWTTYSFTTADRIDPWHLVWDGGAPSYYTHNWNASTDHTVHSPQIEANNWVFMLEEAYRESPEFWFELSVWDGNFLPADKKSKLQSYLAKGQEFTPQRYAGFTQYGMWLTRPRVVREFRGHGISREPWTAYYEALVACVDRVWQQPTLTRFWRHGALVPNRAHKHPYQSAIPKKWQQVDRWYQLDTSLDPPRPWSHDTELPVFALARVIGKPGARQWLLYAHAPVKPRKDVEIKIPEFGGVRVDVAPGGSFYLVREQGGQVAAIR